MIDPLIIEGYGALSTHASLADFPLGAEIELPKPDLTLLDRSLRRGLSDVTRIFFHVANVALTQARAKASDVHVLFASAFGEIGCAEALLQQAYDENASSPARFRHSVHNTAPGLLSISAQNHGFTGAMAAGWDTVAMGLVEANALLCDGAEQVLLVFAEERVPVALSAEHAHGPLGAAFVLSHRAHVSPIARVSGLRRESPAGLESPFAGKNHPLGPALLLARAIELRARTRVIVGEGEAPWVVDIDAREAPP